MIQAKDNVVRTKDKAVWIEKEKLIEDIFSSPLRTINTHHTSKSITTLIFFLKKYLFIWLHQVLAVACGIFSCGMWDL